MAFTIEGNGHTYSGEMTLKGISGDNGQALTIQNVNFERNGNISIVANDKSYLRNLTVDRCSFSGANYYAMSLRHVYDITIKNTTAVNSGYGFFYAPKAVNGLEVDNVEVTGTGYGFNLQYPTNAINFKNMNLDVAGFGLIFACNAKGNITVEDSTIKADTHVTVHSKGAAKCTLTFKGENTLISEDGEWLSNGNEAYFDVIYNGDADEENDFTVVTPVKNVAQIGEQGYETLADAIAAVQNGETIVLLTDSAESVTIKQVANMSFTIDGNGKTYSGTITIDGNKRSTGKETLTIKNVNFVVSSSGIYTTDKTYAHNITVDNCTFTGVEGAAYAYGIALRAAYNVTVSNSKGENLYGFIYAPKAVTGITVDTVEVNDSVVGMYLQSVNQKPAVFKNLNLNVTDSGVTIASDSVTTATFEDCSIVAPIPVKVQKNSNDRKVNLTFIGSNNFGDGNWLTIEGTTADIVVDLTEDTNLDIGNVIYEEGVYGIVTEGEKHTFTELPSVAAIGDKEYKTIQAAVDAAQSGQTITLLADITEDVTVNKSVTIDGAEKIYTGKMNLTAGTITIKNVNFDGKGYNGYAVETRGASSLTIEDCTAKNYAYGFVQIVKSCKLTAKNVTVENVNYGFKVDRSTGVTMENVVVEGARVYGVYDSNYASKSYTIKNCNLSSIEIWERTGYSGTTTFNFEGANTVGILEDSPYAKHVLAEVNATLTSVEGMEIASGVDGYLVVYENGVYRLAKQIAQNTNTGAVYTDLSDGLKEAVSRETVILLAETAEELVLVPAGVTFDLNGHVVEANNVLSFGIVKDSAETVGGIKIDKETTKAFTKLQPENGGYLPIYDTRDGMYKFFEYKLVNAGAKQNGSAVKFGFQITFTNTDAYGVLAETGYSGITLTAMVSWTDMSVPGIEYQFDYAEIQEYAASKAVAPSKNYVVFLSISGLENLAQGDFVSAAPVLTTVTEVACTNEAYEYIIE